MAERKLNHGRESTQELLTHHLQYEIDMLRWTFVRLHNRTLDQSEKNATIESSCIHARKFDRLFLNGRRGKYAYAKDFTADDSHQATSVNGLGRLRGKLSSQIAHITYGRTNEDAGKIGTSELEQLFNLIEDELTKFENHLKEAYAPWQPADRVAIKPGTLPNATNTSSVSGSFLCLRTQTTKTLGSQPLPLEADG